MRALLLYPIFPSSFWSFEKAVEGLGKKAFMPPLGLVTVASLLPQSWDFRLIDHNIEVVSEEDWEWADLILMSGMIAQKKDFLEQIREAKKRGKKVVVGGPYATSLPNDFLEAGADYLVLDEGEYTIPLFLKALENGNESGIFRSKEKPDLSISVIPRFDLFKMDAYFVMAIQYSRGCPFKCEFCDIIILYGRKPRTKTSEQIKKELNVLKELGWRGGIFFVDDNFIGNKRTVKPFLEDLIVWQKENGYPFSFYTEASIDMAHDDELLKLMVYSKFSTVFIGIETPDTDSLKLTLKNQNIKVPMNESLQKIAKIGIRIMGGFIIGFDGEKTGAGERVYKFAIDNAIPGVTFSMLQALPGTALWDRLKREGRLLDAANLNQTTLLNFIPSRPIEDISKEYVETFWKLYEPKNYLTRVYKHFRMVGEAEVHSDPKIRKELANKHKTDKNLNGLLILLEIFWKQGIYRNTRVIFWKYLWQMWKHNRAGIGNYLSYAAFIEHFVYYRKMVKEQIEEQVSYRKETETDNPQNDIELSEEKKSEIIWYEPQLEHEKV
jgi:radical SAM superfamily enzyme YgiQ (UPF0313 family)